MKTKTEPAKRYYTLIVERNDVALTIKVLAPSIKRAMAIASRRGYHTIAYRSPKP